MTQDIESKVAELMPLTENVVQAARVWGRYGSIAAYDDLQAERKILEAALRTALSSSAQVPEGMRLVPVEPTEEMINAGNAAYYGTSTHRPAKILWGVMLQAFRAPALSMSMFANRADYDAAMLSAAPSTLPKE